MCVGCPELSAESLANLAAARAVAQPTTAPCSNCAERDKDVAEFFRPPPWALPPKADQ